MTDTLPTPSLKELADYASDELLELLIQLRNRLKTEELKEKPQ